MYWQSFCTVVIPCMHAHWSCFLCQPFCVSHVFLPPKETVWIITSEDQTPLVTGSINNKSNNNNNNDDDDDNDIDCKEQTHSVDEAFVFIMPLLLDNQQSEIRPTTMTNDHKPSQILLFNSEWITFKKLTLVASDQVMWPHRALKQVTGKPAVTLMIIILLKSQKDPEVKAKWRKHNNSYQFKGSLYCEI